MKKLLLFCLLLFTTSVIWAQTPTATAVSISGTLAEGEQLTGLYTYNANGNGADASTFVWSRADDAAGTNKAVIAGATNDTYTLVSADVGKFIFFEVTPTDGVNPDGTPVEVNDGPVVPKVNFSIDQALAEDNNMTVTATLTTLYSSDVTIPFTVGGTANDPNDYSITASPLVITAGQISANITITVVDDAIDENNETVVVTMGAITNAVAGANNVHTATINDNDLPPTVQFVSVSQTSADENTPLTATVELSAVSGLDVDVDFAALGGSTATLTTDYTLSGSPLTITAGTTTADVTITLVDDAIPEGLETVILELSNPQNATLGANTQHTATITSDDLPAAATLTSPADDVTSQPLYQEFAWTTSAGPAVTEERLQVSTNYDFTNIVFNIDVTGDADGMYELTAPLNYNTYYFWRIVSTNLDGNTNSASRFFKTLTSVVPQPYLPSNGSVVYTKTPTIKWSLTVNNANFTYQVQVHEENDFGATVGNFIVNLGTGQEIGDEEYAIPTDLTPGEDYFWRVRSKNADGNLSDWSSTQSFTVDDKLGAVKPVPTWPIGNPLTYTKTPYLYWVSTSTATNLEYKIELSDGTNTVEIDENGDGTSPITNIFAQITTTNLASATVTGGVAITDLTSSTAYTWKVAAREGAAGVWSDFSNPGTFTMIDNLPGDAIKPTILYPLNEVTIYDSKTSLSYMTGQSPVGYDFHVVVKEVTAATLAAFTASTTTVMDATASDVLIQQATGLLGEKIYGWQVSAIPTGSGAAEIFSDVEFFQTAKILVGALAQPTNVMPADQDDVNISTPTLSWLYSGDFTGVDFEVQYKAAVDTDTDFSDEGWSDADYAGNYGGAQVGPFDPVLNVATSTSYVINTPLNVGQYWWRVRARKGTGMTAEYTAWSIPTSFTISNPYQVVPLKPVAYQPANGFQTNSKTVDFSWIVNGLSTGLDYRLEWRIKGFAWNHLNNKSDVVYIFDAQTVQVVLPETGNYEWRVQSFIDNGNSTYDGETLSDYSEVAEFVVLTQAGPIQPQVGSPIANVTIDTDAPELSWYVPSDGSELKYTVEVATDEAMTKTVMIRDNLSDNKFVLNGLETNQKYFWRVSSKVGEVSSQYSAKGEFSVAANITAIEEITDSEIPAEFALQQNYPNPFNPSTTIEFSVPDSKEVTIKIFNIIGEEVSTLVNKEFQVGTYKVTFDAGNLSSGIYFYKAIYGDKVITKKMMLLK